MLDHDTAELPLFFPLWFACEDYFVPDSAAHLVNGLRDLDNSALAVTIELWAMDAELEVANN